MGYLFTLVSQRLLSDFSMQSIDYLRLYKLRAKKSLGQNFLVDEDILERISENINISQKNIIEVGPWYGALTQHIINKYPQALHLVELDSDMIEMLEERFSPLSPDSSRTGLVEVSSTNQIADPSPDSSESGFKIFHQDVLTFTPEFDTYSVIANIPYYITSPILTHFLYTLNNSPEEMLILMQRDVGDKILAWVTGTGTKVPVPKKLRSSVISLMIAKKCFVTEKLLVPAKSFIPAPKVESSVLYFETHKKYANIDDEGFLSFIKKWFSEPRKKLIKNLAKVGYSSEKISEFLCQQWYNTNMRGEQWDIDFWIELYLFLK